MTLNERIAADLKEAMKAREQSRLDVIRMLKSAIQMAAIEKGGATAVLDDAEVEAVIRRQVTKNLTSVARAGWTLSCGDDLFHAARGAARMALRR